RPDPPHRVSREPEPSVGFELVCCLHQPDISLCNQVGEGQPIARETSSDLDHEPQVAAQKIAQRRGIAVAPPSPSQLLLALRGEYREAFRFAEQLIEGITSIFETNGHLSFSYVDAPVASETFEGMARIESGERFGVKYGKETRKFNIRMGDGCKPPE